MGQPVLLELVLVDRATGKYPRAKILDEVGVQLALVLLSPSPAVPWSYQGAWTPSDPGQVTAVYEVFQDAGHTVPTTHEPGQDPIRVHALGQDLSFQKLLGHLGENVRDDVLSYDANARPLTFRRRIFPTKALADASTPGGAGEGEIVTVVGAATHFDAARWETLLRTLSP